MITDKRQEKIHAHIGQRLRERRKVLNLNQTELANILGVSSYQQLQKYEAGSCHLSAVNLILFANILQVPPNYFYDGIDLDEMLGERNAPGEIPKKRVRPFRILLAESNPADALLFKESLKGIAQKTEIDVVHDAGAVISFLHHYYAKHTQRAPDLVVLAPSTPKLNGVELLKAIKKNPKTMELPVVILTNSIRMKDVMETYKFGAAGFIQKSVVLQEYMETIAMVVNYWSRAVVLPACA